MKSALLGLVAVAALLVVPAAAEAGKYHHRHYDKHRWDTGYRGGWGGPVRRVVPPRVVYRPPVRVYQPYPVYPVPYGAGYGGTSFFYNGPNASFGFGF